MRHHVQAHNEGAAPRKGAMVRAERIRRMNTNPEPTIRRGPSYSAGRAFGRVPLRAAP